MAKSRNLSRTRSTRALKTLSFMQLEQRAMLAADFIANEILVQYHAAVDFNNRSGIRSLVGAELAETIHTFPMQDRGAGVVERLTIPQGMSIDDALAHLKNNPNVKYAEPNWIYQTGSVSDDSIYTAGDLWGMYSDDLPTPVGPASTTNEFGSQAEKAWNKGYTGSASVYVGIIDEGFQYTHPDLDANSWTNPFDLVDGIDNDGNGYIDDKTGWDFYNNNNSTYDGTTDDHGTHVAGTIGGEGGNGQGVAGVNWSVTMISGKFLQGSGSLANAIKAVDYFTDLKVRHGLNIVATNNSWGGGGFSQLLLDAIVRGADEGILFVAAAGNSNSNNEVTPFYPANYSTLAGAGYEAVISVASITNTGTKSSFSSYGATTVDLGAPGSDIYSTLPVSVYGSFSGTSMATPHVAGAVALYASKYPGATATDIRTAILSTVRPTASMAGITVTGGRLDVDAALEFVPPSFPTVAIDDVTIVEGNSPNTATATFVLSLSAASTQTITVNFATADGTAVSTSDYDSASGVLTFAPGATSHAVFVTIRGDNLVENDEQFYVDLSGPVAALLGDAQAVGTITNDDLPTISIANVSTLEGNLGTKTFAFRVTLSAPAVQPVSMNFATSDRSAMAGVDYVANSGLLTIPIGRSQGVIRVTVNGDTTIEPNETFYVNLSDAVNGTFRKTRGVGTIKNDDSSFMMVAGPVGSNESARNVVTDDRLAALFAEAKTRWIASGLVAAADVQNLDVSIKTTDLPGRALGRAAGNTIWIDRNAARRGWYIDSTPNSDLEFVAGTNVRGVDLLSVIGHELGHFLGFDHVDDSQVAVMHEKLRPGARLLPASADDLEMIGISRSRAEAVLPTASRIERLPNSTAAAID
ncbi:MAG: S8 family serine peptidase, partial [Pirellulaceae bacterium]